MKLYVCIHSCFSIVCDANPRSSLLLLNIAKQDIREIERLNCVECYLRKYESTQSNEKKTAVCIVSFYSNTSAFQLI